MGDIDVVSSLSREQRIGKDILVRDLLQTRILSALFASTLKHEMVLKGGLAMRAAHGSPRYTKDIDLQTRPDIAMGRVRSLVESSIRKAVEESGLLEGVVISAPKQTDTVQRWKVNGTMVNGGSNINLTVEVSRRGLPDPEFISSVIYKGMEGTPAVYVESYSPTALAASKVDALTSPNRVAIRDVYDLFHLAIVMEVEPPTYLLKRLGRDALADALRELWPKIEVMDWDMAREHLIPSLPAHVADALDEMEWDAMRLRTEQAVRGWIEKAMDELSGEEELTP